MRQVDLESLYKWDGTEIHFLSTLPKNLNSCKGSYVLSKNALYYVTEKEEIEEVKIKNITELSIELEKLKQDVLKNKSISEKIESRSSSSSQNSNQNISKIFLSGAQILKLITANSGHLPWHCVEWSDIKKPLELPSLSKKLLCAHLPTEPKCIFFGGTVQQPVLRGDGLICEKQTLLHYIELDKLNKTHAKGNTTSAEVLSNDQIMKGKGPSIQQCELSRSKADIFREYQNVRMVISGPRKSKLDFKKTVDLNHPIVLISRNKSIPEDSVTLMIESINQHGDANILVCQFNSNRAAKGNDFHFMEECPQITHDYKLCYIFTNQQKLYYVDFQGSCCEVNLSNTVQFSLALDKINATKSLQIHLTHAQVRDLLHAGGGQIPTGNVLITIDEFKNFEYSDTSLVDLHNRYNVDLKQAEARSFVCTNEQVQLLKRTISEEKEQATRGKIRASDCATKLLIRLGGLFKGIVYHNSWTWIRSILDRSGVLQAANLSFNDEFKIANVEINDWLKWWGKPDEKLRFPSLTTADHWYELGNDYFFARNGKPKHYYNALACYQKALQLDPEHEEANKSIELLSSHSYGANFPPLTLDYYAEAMVDKPYSLFNHQKQHLVLEDIIAIDSVARMKFGTQNWIYILTRLSKSACLSQELIQKALRKVMTFEFSPYTRVGVESTTTAFYGLRNEDPYHLSNILRPNSFFGVNVQINEIKKFLRDIKLNPSLNRHFLLVSGPPGVGKTEIIQMLLKQEGFEINEFQLGDSEDKWRGQLEDRIIRFFANAKKATHPVGLFIDEIDALLSESDSPSADEKDRKISDLFQTEINKLVGTKVVLIGATNYLKRLKPAILSRAGTPVVFKLPNEQARALIVRDYLRYAKLDKDCSHGIQIITLIAVATSGWSARSLKHLIEEVTTSTGNDTAISYKQFETCYQKTCDRLKDLEDGVQMIPAQLKPELPDAEEMSSLTAEGRMAHMQICDFIGNGVKFTKINPGYKVDTLLFGPPGTGKTTFVKRIVQATSCPCFLIKTNMNFLMLQRTFLKAKSLEKAIIFIDEIDVFTSLQSSVREFIQTEMSGFDSSNNVIYIGATNFPEKIAEPIFSRFNLKIKIPLPDKKQRSILLNKKLKQIEHNLKAQHAICFDKELISEVHGGCITLAERTAGFSIRDMESLCNILTGVALNPFLNEDKKSLLEILYDAIEKTKKEKTSRSIRSYSALFDSLPQDTQETLSTLSNSPS